MTYQFDTTNLRGRFKTNVNLSNYTWLGVGGNADIFFVPEDKEDLVQFFKVKPKQIPVTVLGACSNVLIRDKGIEGAVIRLGKEFSYIKQIDQNSIRVGASTLSAFLAKETQVMGISGFEFLSGIPGRIGGALRMNCGAHGSEITNIFKSCIALNYNGILKNFEKQDVKFSYRKSSFPNNLIFLEAVFTGKKEKVTVIEKKINSFIALRKQNQPIQVKTGGSTFKNPDLKISKNKKTWELIKESGCATLSCGGAKLSEVHNNFIINFNNATALDIEKLGEEVVCKVLEKTGIKLEWEIIRLGRK